MISVVGEFTDSRVALLDDQNPRFPLSIACNWYSSPHTLVLAPAYGVGLAWMITSTVSWLKQLLMLLAVTINSYCPTSGLKEILFSS